MSGPGYYAPYVPYVMWFLNNMYSIHGAYWHNNFGRPVSHGCVNLPMAASAWMFYWTPVGTPVSIHY